jgi:hypothetical protein
MNENLNNENENNAIEVLGRRSGRQHRVPSRFLRT